MKHCNQSGRLFQDWRFFHHFYNGLYNGLDEEGRNYLFGKYVVELQ